VAVTDSRSGCSKDTTFTVQVTSIGVNAEVVGKDTLFFGESTTLQANTTGNGNTFTFEWSPSDGLSNPFAATTEAAPEENTIYTVTVTSENGCTATDEAEVFYRGNLCEEPFIFVPKAFTPNNDSNNDFFIIRGVNIVELEFVVWSRWGEKYIKPLMLMRRVGMEHIRGPNLHPILTRGMRACAAGMVLYMKTKGMSHCSSK
jgi:hypothetical protein